MPAHLHQALVPSHDIPSGAHQQSLCRTSKSLWPRYGCLLWIPKSVALQVCDPSKNLQLLYGKQWLLQNECYCLSRWHALTTVVSCSTCVHILSSHNFTWRRENLLFHLDYHMNGREDHQASKSSEAFIKRKSVLPGTSAPDSLHCYRIFIAFLTISDSTLPAETTWISNFSLLQ